MKLNPIDIAIIALYLLSTIFIGLWYRKKARQNQGQLSFGWKIAALVQAGLERRLGYVLYQRHYVDGNAVFCLWHEKHLDTLALAGI